MLRFIAIATLLCVFAAFITAAARPVNDDAITDQVRMKLAGDREVGAAGIDVKVKDGIVELHGVVRKNGVRSKAERIAKHVKGVKQVVNDIQVSTTGVVPAAEQK